MAKRYVPKRGDAVWLHFVPQVGHEQAGRRPAIVVSAESYNRKVGLGLFCPITSVVKGYPFEVAVPDGLGLSGAILSDQVKSLDWRARRAKRIRALPDDVVDSVLAKIRVLVR
jgi:mRNA interferase MazF